MNNLIIIGAGGMGRSLYDNAQESVGYGEIFVVKGFIDDNLAALDGYPNYPPVIGTIKDYIPQENDVFVSSIGGASRRACMEAVISRGGAFMNLIHSTARIRKNVRLGTGNFIGAYVAISNDTEIGDYNMIQTYTVIGHDSKIGNWNRIDTHVVCVGGIVIEDETVIHTSAVISHNVTVETGAHVGALSFVIRKVRAGTTVIGNPAKRLV